jgi:hypothetical protein
MRSGKDGKETENLDLGLCVVFKETVKQTEKQLRLGTIRDKNLPK